MGDTANSVKQIQAEKNKPEEALVRERKKRKLVTSYSVKVSS